MLVYKVVKKVEEKYYSLCGHVFPTYKLEYSVGQLVTPVVGKIFVYTELYNAWYNCSIYDHIMLCESVGFEKIDSSYFPMPNRPELFRDFWSGRVDTGKLALIQCNIGLCEKLIPLKILSAEEERELLKMNGITF